VPCDAVLLVEDDDGLRESLCAHLEDEGYWVFQAANGSEALGILRNMTHSCLILLDLTMPVMNGWQFMDELRKMESAHSRHVIVVTGSDKNGDVPPGTPVIGKPIDLSLLLRYMAAQSDSAEMRH
jgi:CheY-like chemotaxis protein